MEIVENTMIYNKSKLYKPGSTISGGLLVLIWSTTVENETLAFIEIRPKFSLTEVRKFFVHFVFLQNT